MWQLHWVRGQLLHRETKTEASDATLPLPEICVAALQAREITVHDTRQTCATRLAALDVHPHVAMHALRHAQIDVTMNVYTEVSDA